MSTQAPSLSTANSQLSSLHGANDSVNLQCPGKEHVCSPLLVDLNVDSEIEKYSDDSTDDKGHNTKFIEPARDMDLDSYQVTNGEDDDVGACPVDSEYDSKKNPTLERRVG